MFDVGYCRLASDPISSVARVMPDRGVLWKSLNPNTIAVATTTADGATATAVGVPGTKSRAEQAVRVYMIDSVRSAALFIDMCIYMCVDMCVDMCVV